MHLPGTDPLVQLPFSCWHQPIVGSNPSGFFQWDWQTPNTHIRARLDREEIRMHPSVRCSPDGKSVSFDFDPIQIPTPAGMSRMPGTLDIWKQVRWIGPVLDRLPASHYSDLPVSAYPSTIGAVGDDNGDGLVNAAD
jgi:hypothetical protein